MRAALGYASVLYDEYHVGVFDGREPVRYYKARLVFHQIVQSLLYLQLRS